ncbi:MAG: orotidine 5'-phosphate decarboxylase [Patescibacteria group bacterium]|nr:orotidine 5'-phosphate decarboxylase [Patescibacteria group bacterium]
MTELIVALDGPDPLALASELYMAGVRWFKLGPSALMDPEWANLVRPSNEGFENDPLRLFLDIKLADTRETVHRAVTCFAEAGIAAVSTYTDGATEAAVRSAVGSRLRVWRVAHLTDVGYNDETIDDRIRSISVRSHDLFARGLIMPPWLVARQGQMWGDVVCPAVRLEQSATDDGHLFITPARLCPSLGITHVVVGRPIWQAPDPIDSARRYMEALR